MAFIIIAQRSYHNNLPKTDGKIYFLDEDADAALDALGELKQHYTKVRVIGVLDSDWPRYNKDVCNETEND